MELAQPQQQASSQAASPVSTKLATLEDFVDHRKAKYLELSPQFQGCYEEAARADFRHWVPRQPLTPEEESLVTGSEVNVEKWHSLRRDGNRWCRYKKWGMKGSVVFQRDMIKGSDCFGYVLFFFRHVFAGRDHTFAQIQWFQTPEEERESKLFVCNPKTTHLWMNPFVLVDKLSEPLITAHANEEQLFILDFMDRGRWEDILLWLE